MRLFRRPAFPVSPEHRVDGIGGRWVNESTGRGGPMDRHASTVYERPIPLDAYQVDALAEFNALARRIIWREPMDALRPGFRLEWDGLDPALERRTYRWLRRRFDLVGKIKQARAFARATGGAAIVIMSLDGREAHEPLDLAGLRRVHRLVVRDRFEIWPDPQTDLDPESPYYGTARYYLVQGSTKVLRVHASRVVRFDGLPVSDRSRALRNGWGGSYFDLIYDALRNYGSSVEDAAEAITLLTQGVFQLDGFADAVDRGDAEKLARRYKAMRMGMGTLGDIVVDKATESYTLQSRSFAGVGEILDKLLEALIACTDMPEVVLRGNRSAGLNGGSEGDDLRAWYDLCGSERDDHYGSQLLDLLEVLLADPESPTGGLVPVDLGIDWPPMWSPTAAQAADVRTKNAQARAADVAAGIIDETEARTDNDLGEWYELAEQIDEGTGLPIKPRAPRAVSLEPDEQPLVVQDETAIPDGETPVSATEAAKRLGYSSAGPILRMVNDGKIRVWRPGGRGPYRVLMSEVARESAYDPVGALDRAIALGGQQAVGQGPAATM